MVVEESRGAGKAFQDALRVHVSASILRIRTVRLMLSLVAHDSLFRTSSCQGARGSTAWAPDLRLDPWRFNSKPVLFLQLHGLRTFRVPADTVLQAPHTHGMQACQASTVGSPGSLHSITHVSKHALQGSTLAVIRVPSRHNVLALGRHAIVVFFHASHHLTVMLVSRVVAARCQSDSRCRCGLHRHHDLPLCLHSLEDALLGGAVVWLFCGYESGCTVRAAPKIERVLHQLVNSRKVEAESFPQDAFVCAASSKLHFEGLRKRQNKEHRQITNFLARHTGCSIDADACHMFSV